MRILLLGAGGFIGRHILSDLITAGHDVVGVVRPGPDLTAVFPAASFVALDLAHTLSAEDWSGHLAGVDAVVNAAGVLDGRDMDAVHIDMPRALYEAASRAGVKRTVLISAISAREDVATDYSLSKLSGEAVLRSSGLEWILLRPSLVYGDGSYGGTSLIRGMAGLPLAVPLPDSGDFAFSPIHARDLARTVRIACEGGIAPCEVLEPAGPDTMNLMDILARYRAWLGFAPARFLHVPMPLMRLLGWIGDRAGDGPISTNSLVQMAAGNAGDGGAFAKAVGFEPRSLDDALRDSPAQVQDRWHARLFFLVPALKAALLLLWLVSAWAGLTHGAEQAKAFAHSIGLPPVWADPLRIGSSVLDIAIAVHLAVARSAMRTALVQLAVVFGYSVVIGVALPHQWLDPLGSLLKNLPIMVAIAIYGVIGDKR